MLPQGRGRQRLGKAVRNPFCCRCTNQRNCTFLDVFTNDMMSNFDVLRTSPCDRVQGQINGTLIVTMQWDGIVDTEPEFLKETPIPCSLVGRIGHGHVFRFSGVLGHSLLLSRGPAYSTVS